ncbi:MAG TPA: SdrD B-like domain-containing protein [Gemmatimonadota bacterium]|nr:SdrD B-like domain-containing protein [Gemmatimonadota bacterium]
MIRRAGLTSLLAAVAALAACDRKEEAFFRLVGEGGSADDNTAPVFSNAQPPVTSSPVNVDAFTIQVTDPPGDGGPGSGVDPASVTASVSGGGSLPVTVDLPTVTIDVSGLPDGPVQVVVSARDRAGNQSVFTFSHVLDRAPPSVDFVLVPPAQDQTNAATYRAVVTVAVGTDPGFAGASVEARTPGADGQCGTSDDGTLPTSILENPVRPLAGPGEHTVEFVLENPVDPGGAAQVVDVCWTARATDSAVGPTGAPDPNVSVVSSRTTIEFQPPSPTTGTVEGRVTDGGIGVAGATVDLLTPAGTALRTTTTDATGFYRFTAVEPGDYRVRGTVDGRTCGDVQTDVDAGEVVVVNLACPPPTGAIGGQVTAGGEGLGGAVVTVSQGGSVVGTATTGSSGTYLVSGLAPGAYEVAVEAPTGFACPTEPVSAGVQSGQTTTVNFSCQSQTAGPPPGDEVAGDWSYERTLVSADGTCPAPLAVSANGRIAHDFGTSSLFVRALHPQVDPIICVYDPQTGMCTGGGEAGDGAGNTLRVAYDAVFERDDSGIVMTDQMVVEHVDGSDVTFCTETYQVSGTRQ